MKAITEIYPVSRDAGSLVEVIDVSEDHGASVIRVDVLGVARASNTLMSTDETVRPHNL